jgi:hypothetical protein
MVLPSPAGDDTTEVTLVVPSHAGDNPAMS